MQASLEAMRAGARNAVQVCMGVGANDRVFVVTDTVTEPIGRLLAEESQAVASSVTMHRLEEFAPRPITDVPPRLVEACFDFAPTVIFFTAQSLRGEIGFRIKFRPMIMEGLPVRWGHMPGITPQIMATGMREDYRTIADITERVTDRVRGTREMRITSPRGTDLTVGFSRELHWRACTGLYHQVGDWGNLPEGETFTTPASMHGIIVAEELGDYFSEKYGILSETPVTFHVQDGIVTHVACADQAMADEVWGHLSSAENGTRAGEFSIGTNTGLTKLIGNLLQDEKIPGVHIAFGNPYQKDTGAQWSSTIHVDVIPLNVTILTDGRLLFDGTRFHL